MGVGVCCQPPPPPPPVFIIFPLPTLIPPLPVVDDSVVDGISIITLKMCHCSGDYFRSHLDA